MNIRVLGVDIAKNIFQLHCVDSFGKRVLKKRTKREKLSAHIANLPLCTIAMESCGGANYWTRVFQQQGHTVKLVRPQYIKSFVKINKKIK